MTTVFERIQMDEKERICLDLKKDLLTLQVLIDKLRDSQNYEIRCSTLEKIETWARSFMADSRELADVINTERGKCQECGREWKSGEADKNAHGCVTEEGSTNKRTRCPDCGWCAVCEEVRK